MGQMLTAKQVAEVKGCSYQYVKRIIKEGKLQAQEILNDKNRKTYLVPLEALDEELQQKWYQMNLENPPEEISTPEPVTDKKAVDHFSESERQEIDFWISLVEQWQQYRMKPGVTCKADVDKKFVTLCGLEYPDKEISVDIMYRKWKAVKENDLDGLIDKRGKWKKGTSSIDDTIWQAFLYFYLDESQHPIQKCLDYTKMWAQEKRPDLYTDIPSYSAFYRRLNNEVPEGVKVLGREGHKAYNDRCAPFIRRIYEDIESNEWWIADNHTFDVMVKDKNGNIHRPYLTAFLDARSGIFTGFHITYKAVISFSNEEDLWKEWEEIYTDLSNENHEADAREFFERHREKMLEGTEVLWEEKLSYYDLMVMRLTEGEASFNSEEQNEPINPEDCIFNPEWFEFYNEAEIDFKNRDFLFFGFVDPSLGKTKHSDFSAIITLAKHKVSGYMYVMDADIERRHPDKIIGDILEKEKMLRRDYGRGYKKFGAETVQFQWFLKEELAKASAKAGLYLPIEEVPQTSDKTMRIQTMQPDVKNHYIKFNKRHKRLLEQMEHFPMGAHDDGVDALEGCRTIAKKMKRFRVLDKGKLGL